MKRTVIYLKLFWYKVFVHEKLKLLDFLSDFVLTYHLIRFSQLVVKKVNGGQKGDFVCWPSRFRGMINH